MQEKSSRQYSRDQWENRACEKGASLNSVLYRGLDEQLNRVIHKWHVMALATHLLPRIPYGGSILDVCCGYGRLSREVAELRPDIRIVGMDFSFEFCRHFNELAPVVCADIHKPPFDDASFDSLFAITAMMYVLPDRRDAVLTRLMQLVKPGGSCLLVDPGAEYMRLAARLRPSSRDTPTGGEWFTIAEYLHLADGPGRRLAGCGGIPAFSFLLPLLNACAKVPILGAKLVETANAIDRILHRSKTWSIQRWMLVERSDG